MAKNKFNIQQIVSRVFDLINLPSEGKFYDCGTSKLKIRHLSGIEEKVMDSYFLSESGEALKIILENLIIDEFEIEKLIISDLQGITIFLYATAFSNEINYKVKCPSCGYEDEVDVVLSSLKNKKTETEPIDGRFIFRTKYSKIYENFVYDIIDIDEEKYIDIIFKPLTFGDLLELKNNNVDINLATNKLSANIESIGGNRDKKHINSFIKSLKLGEFKKIKDFFNKNEIGINDKIPHSCERCGAESSFPLNLGYNILRFPENHRHNVLEECFLLSHYNNGGIEFDKVAELPTNERRWLINRLQKELEKKREAEEKAYNKAKSKR